MKSAKHILAMVMSKPATMKDEESPAHEAAETPAEETAEHEGDGDEGPINAGAAYDLHSKLSSHFSRQSGQFGGKDETPDKGLGLDKLDTGLMDRKKAAAHLHHLARHFEKKSGPKGY